MDHVNKPEVAKAVPASLSWSATGYEAFFEEGLPSRDIERWDAEGRPLVVSEEHRGLVRAEDLPGFTGIDICHRPMAVVPAAAGTTTAEGRPVRAWMVDADSFAYPVTEDF
ncbi:hypothetical protein EIL87_19800 [Saccharopolyspora rhizosphaerae]|uniref:Uncharacterized protein n=1 Tax=Saccharopolyspora rhizosphaerae TaxID=2492662 RepID=A0A3R8QZH1_9PSEU|nr:hypothetical protein [Saccharopolyspora rhizosphaerae]RRO14550.1 hypothetical protein EIL87_19800 [Saccharopolyspora rhizosphaerae]